MDTQNFLDKGHTVDWDGRLGGRPRSRHDELQREGMERVSGDRLHLENKHVPNGGG
jgi:hypothetical protein